MLPDIICMVKYTEAAWFTEQQVKGYSREYTVKEIFNVKDDNLGKFNMNLRAKS